MGWDKKTETAYIRIDHTKFWIEVDVPLSKLRNFIKEYPSQAVRTRRGYKKRKKLEMKKREDNEYTERYCAADAPGND